MTHAVNESFSLARADTTGILRASLPSRQLQRGNLAEEPERVDFVFVKRANGRLEIGSLSQSTSMTEFDKQFPGEVDIVQPVPRFPDEGMAFNILQMFEGTVRTIDTENQEFSAELRDLTLGRQVEEEEAVLPLEDVPPGDRDLVAPGAVFRWAIGYEDRPGGQRDRVSRMRFIRSGEWSSREVKEIFGAAEAALREIEVADRETSER